MLPLLSAIVDRESEQRVIGVEREYEIRRRGVPVDGRTLWPRLEGLGAALDPADRNARRGPTGGVLTVDGREAEVAIPPVELTRGSTHRALAHAVAGERHLRACLPIDHGLHGYSTHLSVEVVDRNAAQIAVLIARRLALPLMLMLDRRTSPGLLVRPRHNRLEICGEFAAGRQLRAATSLTVSIVLLAERALCDRSLRRSLQTGPSPRLVPAAERFGWYVDRRAFGPDLYDAVRHSAIRQGRRMVLAGEVLATTWTAARPHGETVLDVDELELVDRVIDGHDPLPLEHPLDDDGPVLGVRDDRWYGPRHVGDVSVSVVAATWWRAMLEVRCDEHARWLTVPGRALDAVLDGLDDPELAGEIASLIARRAPAEA